MSGVGFPGSFMFTLVPMLIVGVIVFMIGSSLVRWTSNNASPRQDRPATIVSKRPHTWGSGTGHGAALSTAHTSYYVTFEFHDRSRLELPVAPRSYGLLAEGDVGMLTHQGTRFIDFVREPIDV